MTKAARGGDGAELVRVRPGGIPAAPPMRRPEQIDVTAPRPLSAQMTFATAGRVLAQLRADHRTVALMLIVPSALLTLVNVMFDDQTQFNHTGLSLLGIFPFSTMFLITSVAMVRERTSGTLERLLTTRIAKLDLLLGYGIAFALAAAAQAVVTSATAYWVLDLYTPGSPALVVAIAVVSAVLGMSLGLLCSAFATTEFQAVQFMPAVVTPQMLLGGLFVPREQMSDWLHHVSAALPMTYDIEALGEVGKTSLITVKLVRDTGVMVGFTMLALTLAAATLRRSTGPLSRPTRRAILLIPMGALVITAAAVTNLITQSTRYVTTQNAQIDGDPIAIVAPSTGTLVDWNLTLGSALSRNRIIGRIQDQRSTPASQHVIRAPADGTIAHTSIVQGAFVTVGSELAVAYDPADVYVTARVKETEIDAVRPGLRADISVDAAPDRTLTGLVWDVSPNTSGTFAPLTLPNNTTGSFQKVTQVIPIKILIPHLTDAALVPGMSVTVRIHKK